MLAESMVAYSTLATPLPFILLIPKLMTLQLSATAARHRRAFYPIPLLRLRRSLQVLHMLPLLPIRSQPFVVALVRIHVHSMSIVRTHYLFIVQSIAHLEYVRPSSPAAATLSMKSSTKTSLAQV